MKFVDEVSVRVVGGHGGPGLVSWRREKYLPRGGPDGGNGGNGGAVVLLATPGLNTLIDFSFYSTILADKGESGGVNNRFGKDGKDLLLEVPVGTQVYYEDQLIADLSVPGARWIAARGGRGGKGNTHFKTSTRQAPDFAQPGEPGDDHEFRLVLKSVADVGLVGLPNVGKSSLITAISASRPSIAAYPFTTIRPNLGVVQLPSERRFVVADIPGLIPDAHLGKGLGIRFLKHIERTKIIAQLIDVSSTIGDDENALLEQRSDEELCQAAIRQYETIEHELSSFSELLRERKRVIVFTKSDLEDSKRAFQASRAWFEKRGLPVALISSHTRDGLDELKELLYREIFDGSLEISETYQNEQAQALQH